MKQYSLLTAIALGVAAALSLAACSDNDDIATGQQTVSEQQVIDFNAYTGRASTRASNNTIDELKNGTGLGIYSLYTNGEKYTPDSTTGEHSFTANFMKNNNLKFATIRSGSNTEDKWYYTGQRYWPSSANEYLTFVAYAPWNSDTKLYAKSGSAFTEDGDDAIYIRYDVSTDKSKMKDMLYSEIDSTANMQDYSPDGGKTWVMSGKFYDDGSAIQSRPVWLHMKHACARIGINVSTTDLNGYPSAPYPVYLYLDPDNPKDSGDGYEYTNASIVVNKVMLLGDSLTAEDATPTGAFYPYAYLNLAKPTEEKPFWAGQPADGKIAVAWTNTDDSLEMTCGTGYFSNSKTWVPDDNDTLGNVIRGRRPVTNVYGTTTNEIGNKKNGYLFIVPQDFSATASDKLFCYVDYNIKYADSNVSTNHRAYFRVKEDFKAGKAYTLCINIWLGSGRQVAFAVHVEKSFLDYAESEDFTVGQ